MQLETFLYSVALNRVIYHLSQLNRLTIRVGVGIATGYGLDEREVGVRVPAESKIFSSPRRSRPALGPSQPLIQWVPGAPSPRVKRQGRESNYSTPTSAEVKKT
jgi:hypothetical protein